VPHHHVTDDGGVLDDATKTAVESELKAYETSTGHQVIVWIGRTTGGVPLETWTAETAHEWKVGRSKKDDGVVLFLFMDDRKVRIEVGYGLEGKLTDADAKRIIDDEITPRLRAGDPNAAVTGGVAAIIKTITPSSTGVVEAPATRSNISGIITACVIGFFLLIGAVVLCGQILRLIWFGILVMGEGAKKANASMDNSGWRFFGGGVGFGGGGGGGGSGGSSDDFSSSDDDFSSGGGDFGGGGASGSW
jgi:uncharacterized protein